MESWENLIQIAGKDSVKILCNAVKQSSSSTEALIALRIINREIGKFKLKLKTACKINEDSGRSEYFDVSKTSHKEVQTDMLGLLHPNGQFVNLYYGKISDVSINCDTIDKAVEAYENLHDAPSLPEINTNKISQDSSRFISQISSRFNYLVKKGRRNQVLKPFAMPGEGNIKTNDETFKFVTPADKGILETGSNEIGVINELEKKQISASIVNKDNKSVSSSATLKLGQKVKVHMSKLTPLPKDAILKQISNVSLRQMKQDLLNSDTLSETSSIDIRDLDELVHGPNEKFENTINTLDKNCFTKPNKNSTLPVMFKLWKFCDVLDHNGQAIIHKAVLNSDLGLLKMQCLALKSKRNNVNLQDKQQKNPLELSILNESDINVFKILLRYGMNIEETNPDTGNNALHLAVMHTENMQIFQYIVDQSSLSATCKHNDSGFTPLHLAVRHYSSNVQKLKILLSNKYLENFLNISDLSSGKTALFHAMETNKATFVRILLQNGADPNIPTLSGALLSETYFDFGISDKLKCEFKQIIKDKEKKTVKRIRPDEFSYISKMSVLEKIPKLC